MADDLDKLLTARAAANEADELDALLTARAAPPTKAPGSRFREPDEKELAEFKAWNEQDRSMPWYKRAAFGMADPLVGAGQLIQNVVPDAALNAGRKAGASLLGAVGADDMAAEVGRPVSTDEFNAGVRRREQGIQADRGDAGQEGMDWWRVAGNVANPVTWLSPSGTGAGVLNGIRAGAAQGAFQALLQPVTDKGSFLYDKAMQTAVGTAVGGTLGGALEAMRPAFRYARTALGKAFGEAGDAAQQAAAGKVADDILKASGADPAKVDPNLYASIRQEVGDALKAGVDPDPKIMLNRADAASLPIPMKLTLAEAGGDPIRWQTEHRISGMQGVGEPLSSAKNEGNRLLIENLNALGAKNAPSTFDTAQRVISHIQSVDDAAKASVDAAYSKVRDSAGRPALMDQQAFQQTAREGLEQAQLTEFVPDAIKKQYNALAQGQLPLTVDTAQTLDRVWSAEQRAAQGSAKMAIGKLRDALNNAPVNDDLGAESMQAYKAARELARQRFAAMEKSPAYKAVVDGVEPDNFFKKYVQGANVSELKSLKSLVGPENTLLLQNTFLGNLKNHVLNNASDERGVFSNSKYNGVLQNQAQTPRIAELFSDSPGTLGQLYRIGRVAEMRDRVPAGSRVNFSNTAANNANVVRDIAKSELGNALWSTTRLGPIRQILKEAKERSATSQFVSESLNPGVTAQPLKKVAPSTQTRKLSEIAARASAATAVSSGDE